MLKDDLDVTKKLADTTTDENTKLKEAEKMMFRLQEENRDFKAKIEELQSSIFNKDRDIGKLKHSL